MICFCFSLRKRNALQFSFHLIYFNLPISQFTHLCVLRVNWNGDIGIPSKYVSEENCNSSKCSTNNVLLRTVCTSIADYRQVLKSLSLQPYVGIMRHKQFAYWPLDMAWAHPSVWFFHLLYHSDKNSEVCSFINIMAHICSINHMIWGKNCNFMGSTACHWGSPFKTTTLYLIYPKRSILVP